MGLKKNMARQRWDTADASDNTRRERARVLRADRRTAEASHTSRLRRNSRFGIMPLMPPPPICGPRRVHDAGGITRKVDDARRRRGVDRRKHTVDAAAARPAHRRKRS